MQGNFSHGTRYLLRGAKMLNHKSLRMFVIIPLLINIVIFGSLIGFTVSYLSELMNSWLN